MAFSRSLVNEMRLGNSLDSVKRKRIYEIVSLKWFSLPMTRFYICGGGMFFSVTRHESLKHNVSFLNVMMNVMSAASHGCLFLVLPTPAGWLRSTEKEIKIKKECESLFENSAAENKWRKWAALLKIPDHDFQSGFDVKGKKSMLPFKKHRRCCHSKSFSFAIFMHLSKTLLGL